MTTTSIGSSGPLRFSTLKNVFGTSGPVRFSTFKRDNVYVPNISANTNIPTTYTNLQLKKFYNTTVVRTITLPNGNTETLNLLTTVTTTFGTLNTAKKYVKLVIPSGAIVGTTNSAVAALDIGQFPTGTIIEIENNGSIQGAGGLAGAGGTVYGAAANTVGGPYSGGKGGDAIKANYLNQTVTITNNGTIYAGGGGGGGGAKGATAANIINFGYPIIGNYSGGVSSVVINSIKYDVEMSGGWTNFVMFLNPTGQLFSCGTNNKGQLGTLNTTHISTPVNICNIPSSPLYGLKIKCYAIGELNSFVIDENGELWGWGTNEFGQLANGNVAADTNTYNVTPTKIPKSLFSNRKLSAVAVSNPSQTTCMTVFVIDELGKLWGWGRRTAGSIPDSGSTPTYITTPVNVSQYGSLIGKTIVSVACGWEAGLALDNTGQVHSWGAFNVGNGVENYSKNVYISTNISGYGSINGKIIVGVHIQYSSRLLLDSTGTLHGWGAISGLLNAPYKSSEYTTPINISQYCAAINGKKLVSISCTLNNGIALDVNGKVYSWGNNVHGTIGNGTTDQNLNSNPIDISSFGSLSGKVIKKCMVNYLGKQVIDSNGLIHVWGLNNVYTLPLKSGPLGLDGFNYTLPTSTTRWNNSENLMTTGSTGIGGDGGNGGGGGAGRGYNNTSITSTQGFAGSSGTNGANSGVTGVTGGNGGAFGASGTASTAGAGAAGYYLVKGSASVTLIGGTTAGLLA